MNFSAILEGLLFIVGEEGLSIKEIARILEIEEEQVAEVIKNLEEEYTKENRGIQLMILGNHLKLTTKKEYKKYYEKIVPENEAILSQAALETLAIVAYNQPITRSQVDEIRGIGSSHMIRKLVARNLIKEMGRSDTPGRPTLYGTTDDFLDYFGLSTIQELPQIETVDKVLEETDLYETRYQELEQN